MNGLRKISFYLALTTLVVGVLVVFGWILKIELIKSILPHFVTMKFTTALCFVLAGTAAVLASKPFKHRRMCENVLLAMLSISSVFIVQDQIYAYAYKYVSFWDRIYIDNSPVFTYVSGRPSVGTLVLFLLLDLIEVTYILNLNSSTYIFRRLISGAVMVAAVVALIGYAIGEPSLYYYSKESSTAMAIHTAVLFLLLGSSHFVNTYQSRSHDG